MALSITLLVALAVALGVGEWVHHYRTPHADERHGGFRLDLLAGSALTLAVVMCSFMLAITYSHFNDAADDASREASDVAGLYDAAGLLPDQVDAQRIQQDTVCYARAVASDEWPRLGHSTRASPLVEQWRVRLQSDIRRSGISNNSSALSTVRDAEQLRTTSHQIRLITSTRTAPFYLIALLIIVCAASIFFVTAFTVHEIPRRLRLSVVAVLTVLLATTLAVIVDLDHPYTGVSNVTEKDMVRVAQNSTINYTVLWREPVTACDNHGIPAATPP